MLFTKTETIEVLEDVMKRKSDAQSVPIYDKRDSRGWKNVKHGVSSPHPDLTRITLAEARALGMCESSELIISPVKVENR